MTWFIQTGQVGGYSFSQQSHEYLRAFNIDGCVQLRYKHAGGID